MKYKFVSKEQARNDWENGRVQIEHLGKGRSTELNQLLDSPVKGLFYFYTKNGRSGDLPFPGIPSIPTDELWEMIFGEYQQEIGNIWKELWDAKYGEYQQEDLSSNLSKIQDEIIGYELNGKVDAKTMAILLGTGDKTKDGLFFWGDHLKNNFYAIQRAKDLGILSTCFNPIYKQKEVKVNIGGVSGFEATVTKDAVKFPIDVVGLSITDIQKILDAHNKL